MHGGVDQAPDGLVIHDLGRVVARRPATRDRLVDIHRAIPPVSEAAAWTLCRKPSRTQGPVGRGRHIGAPGGRGVGRASEPSCDPHIFPRLLMAPTAAWTGWTRPANRIGRPPRGLSHSSGTFPSGMPLLVSLHLTHHSRTIVYYCRLTNGHYLGDHPASEVDRRLTGRVQRSASARRD